MKDVFNITGRVAIITGGSGLLGGQHAEAVAERGAIPVLVDIDGERARGRAAAVASAFGVSAMGLATDITRPEAVADMLRRVLDAHGRVDILVNNAAYNPTVSADDPDEAWSRFERFPLSVWNRDLAVSLTGAFLCSQAVGAEMARRRSGVILNISSDLGIIAPDQRLYRRAGLSEDRQPVKPVSYSVVKSGLLGLTRYLATYWADSGVRVNALCPGGVETGQPEEFKERLRFRIPMGRMATQDEYKGAVVFLVSDASVYMTGATLVVDGGRTCW
jgi:NAD(P)-dependent dehydrogenase (short-subunit alcohol dehydrogenase family)